MYIKINGKKDKFKKANFKKSIYSLSLILLVGGLVFGFQNFMASGSAATTSRASAILAAGTTSVSTPRASPSGTPLNVGPVNLNCVGKACQGENVQVNALGSGINGPIDAQTGLQVIISKDNWWTGGNVGEVDGMNIMVRQNSATTNSDSSGILVNVQNQGNGFLSATEFVSSIVSPTAGITREIDVQEGVLDAKVGNYIGAVYNADVGALGTGILIQNTSPTSSWQNAIQFSKNGNILFSVDGSGNIAGSSLYLGGVALNGDASNGSADVGNLANTVATPYVDLNGFGQTNNVRLINDTNGQLTINTVTGGNLQINAAGVFTTGSYHVRLETPSSSSAPCTKGQIGADENYVYVCVETNKWRRSVLSSF